MTSFEVQKNTDPILKICKKEDINHEKCGFFQSERGEPKLSIVDYGDYTISYDNDDYSDAWQTIGCAKLNSQVCIEDKHIRYMIDNECICHNNALITEFVETFDTYKEVIEDTDYSSLNDFLDNFKNLTDVQKLFCESACKTCQNQYTKSVCFDHNGSIENVNKFLQKFGAYYDCDPCPDSRIFNYDIGQGGIVQSDKQKQETQRRQDEQAKENERAREMYNNNAKNNTIIPNPDDRIVDTRVPTIVERKIDPAPVVLVVIIGILVIISALFLIDERQRKRNKEAVRTRSSVATI